MSNAIGMNIHLFLGLTAAAGFTYIIWILAKKESGAAKMIGNIIAAVLAILLIIALVVGGYKCATNKYSDRGMGPKHGKMMKMKEMMKTMPCPMMQKSTPEAKAKAK